ncbi:alpha-N-acetylglucosaminidase [Salinimonas lutimaris]|uniref:alpha-N-acetylglucosaminidase n=1 Tax=Salinimonas lutimaris TaxID=914153 RepID=UPI001586D0AD|nr:alpha-N-acetylglucosaminidase [Salinimonas lutimaris]
MALLSGLYGCSEPVVKPLQRSAQEQAASEVISRVTGRDQPGVIMKYIADNEPDWYQVKTTNTHMTVSGNSTTAMTYGAYEALREQGALSVSWEGNRVAMPTRWQPQQSEVTATPFALRSYLNVCAYGYTTPWWTWQRWEQELDWMALHGVNNPVAMEGQEFVWQQLWSEFGVSDKALASYFSGPAFTPWQRMGNIESHAGPLPQSWINKKHKLQKKILARMEELGMQPVVPAFSGYVPKAFALQHPDAKIYAMPKWTGFEHETYWLDPADPLFNKLAKRFIELYTDSYGKHRYYLSDAFNEMLPPVSQDNRYEDLARYGERIFSSITQVSDDAVWVMQGWMFGADEEFWDLPSIEAFLSNVPDQQAMIHDIGNDRYHVWQRTEGFKGKSWVFGFIHNYGGSDPVYAGLSDYVTQLQTAEQANIQGNMTGFGVFPEGLHNNSVAYEFLFDLPWQTQPDMQKWLQTYTRARYGKTSPTLIAAWKQLIDGVFSTSYWQSRWWEGSAGAYLLFKRPDETLVEFGGHPGNEQALNDALATLIKLAPDYQNSTLFMYDLVDFTKHAVSLRTDSKLQQAVSAYKEGDVEKGDRLTAAVTRDIKQLDALMGLHQESLHSWLTDASNYADTPQEEVVYLQNARQQITIWGGPKLKDYASKAWQGMYAGFYLPRWQMYLRALRTAAVNHIPFDHDATSQQILDWEQDWVNRTRIPPLHVPEQPVEQIMMLLR